MIIQVNEDWRITTDSYNVTVEKRRVKKESDESYWTSQGHFNRVDQAAKWMLDQHVRDFEGSDVDKLCKTLKHLYAQIEQACKVPTLI